MLNAAGFVRISGIIPRGMHQWVHAERERRRMQLGRDVNIGEILTDALISLRKRVEAGAETLEEKQRQQQASTRTAAEEERSFPCEVCKEKSGTGFFFDDRWLCGDCALRQYDGARLAEEEAAS